MRAVELDAAEQMDATTADPQVPADTLVDGARVGDLDGAHVALHVGEILPKGVMPQGPSDTHGARVSR